MKLLFFFPKEETCTHLKKQDGKKNSLNNVIQQANSLSQTFPVKICCIKIKQMLVSKHVYHRERIYFSSTLSCNEKEERNTKPLTLGSSAHFNQPSNFGLISPKINQATLGLSAHFNQPGNIEQHMAWDLFLLPASTADSTLLPQTKDK